MALLLPGIVGFSIPSPKQPTSRSAFFRDLSTALVITASTPLVANADVTAKLASSAALRKVKSCQNKLSLLETSVSDQDFLAIRQTLREAPFSDLRKNMSTLVKGSEDGPDAASMAAQYKKFITSLETMDVRAGQGARGQKVSADEINGYFGAVQTNLNEFLLMAEASAEIPVQYDSATASQ